MNRMIIIVLLSGIVLFGCGKTEDIAQSGGRIVGEATGGFVSGASEGIDNQMMIKAELSSELQQLGVSATIAKVVLDAGTETKTISVYLIAQKGCNHTLIARALMSDGREIGRAKARVSIPVNDAQYVRFPFDHNIDQALVAKYEIGIAH